MLDRDGQVRRAVVRIYYQKYIPKLGRTALGVAKAALEAVAGPVMLMSGVSREGLTEVLRAVRRLVDANRQAERDAVEEPGPWRP